MSLLLEPKEQLQELPQYTILMAVAVAEAIDELLGVDSQIKWVNDIYLNHKNRWYLIGSHDRYRKQLIKIYYHWHGYQLFDSPRKLS